MSKKKNRSQVIDSQDSFSQGFKDALPIILGYLPYGIAFGALAKQVGWSFLETFLMSTVVYAGTAQLVAVGLYEIGQPIFTIALACLVINLRYLLLSTALVPQIRHWKKKLEKLYLGFYLSDETFAILSSRFSLKGIPSGYSIGVITVGVIAWLGSSAVGHLLGSSLTNTHSWGLDFTLPAVFMGLLVMLIKDRIGVVVAGLGAIFSLFFLQTQFAEWSSVLAAIVGATAGYQVKQWYIQKS